jgi:cholesterol transport system auxiliary component
MIHRLLLPVLACLLLAGCLGLGSGTAPPRVFDLMSTTAPSAIAAPRPQQLSIGEPRASQMLDSVRIAVRPHAGELRYYARAAWRDPAPRLVQDAVLRAFEDAAAFAAVGRAGGGLRGELQLEIELRRFEAVYAHPDRDPQALIEVQVTLMEGRTGRAVASTRLSAERAVDGVEVPAVTRALASATDEVLVELVQWAYREAGRGEAR